MVRSSKSSQERLSLELCHLEESCSDVLSELTSLTMREEDFQKAKDARIVEIVATIEGLKREVETLSKFPKTLEIKKQLASLLVEMGRLTEKLDFVRVEIDSYDVETARAGERKASQEIYEVKRAIAEAKVAVKWRPGDLCPTCHALFTDERVAELVKENSTIVVENTTKLSALERTAKDCQKALEQREEKLKVLESYHGQLARLSNEIEQLRSKLSDVKLIEQKRENLQKTIEREENEIEKIKSEQSPFPPMIEEKSKKLDELVKRRDEARKEYDNEIEGCKYYEFWVEGFGLRGIRAYVLSRVTPYLTSRTNRYLDILTGGDVRVSFEMESNKLRIYANNQHGAKVYKGNSGGEKQRIDLAISLALQNLCLVRGSHTLDLLILDEVLVNLDSVGVEMVMDLLKELGSDKRIILFATNDSKVEEHIPDRILVRKSGSVSTIVGVRNG